MNLFYATEIEGDRCLFSPAESHHCAKVLRLREGDSVWVTDGRGSMYAAELCLVSDRCCAARIIQTLRKEGAAPASRPGVHIVMAPTKNIDRTEWFLEKAAEVGLGRITFIRTEHSERKVMRDERVEAVLLAAMKQSQQAFLPLSSSLMDLREYMAHREEILREESLFSEGHQPESLSSEGHQPESLCTESPATESPATEGPHKEGLPTESFQPESLRTESPATESPHKEGLPTESFQPESLCTESPATEGPHKEGLPTEGLSTECPVTRAGATVQDPYPQKFIAYCGPEYPRKEFTDVLSPCEPYEVMIGPEGDFSPAEVAFCVEKGYIPVSLGPTRLRTETAALFAAWARAYKK